MSTATTAAAPAEPTTAREFYDQGVRLAALRKHADAAEAFSQCLELLREESHPQQDDAGKKDEEKKEPGPEDGEDDPKLAPVMHKYGRELMHHGITSSNALGGGGGGGGANKGAALPSQVAPAGVSSDTSKAAAAGSSSGPSSSAADPAGKKLISFSGDTEDFDADDDEEQEGEGGEGDEEEETDMDLAFAALSVARQLYERVLSAPSPTLELIDGTVLTSTEISWQLANVLTDLGEYNLETESFTDAAADFQAALDVLEPVTDPLAFSRRLAEAHFQLALALEYHPDTERRTRALNHAQTTQRLLKERRGALVERRDSGTAPLPRDPSSAAAAAEGTGAANGKGKGKAAAAPARLAEDDVRTLTKEKAVLEIHEVDELLKDLDSKVEELQASVANGANGSTSSDDAVRKAIDQAFLGGAVESNPFSSTTSAANAGPANDLTTLVKKKKKPTATPAATAAASTEPAGEKRKAADEAAEPAGSKKARVDNAEDGE